MIRILHITEWLARNGTETFIMNLFREALKYDIIFDFLLTHESKEGYYEEACSMGSKIFFLPSRRDNPWKYHSSLDNFFRLHAKEYAGVHMSGNSMSSISPLKYARKYEIPLRIFHSHNSTCSGFHNKVLHKLNKLVISKYATHYLACSKSALKWAFSNTPAEKSAQVINNGIDIKKYSYSKHIRDLYRDDMSLQDKFVIGHVGRFMTEKNHKFLIDIFHEVLNIKPDSILLLVGKGGLEDEIVKYVNKLNISQYVRFSGVRDDVDGLLQAMDLFIMPSIFEGLPFVLVEAQAAGLPIIASANITDEVAITSDFNFMSLSAPPQKWAQLACKYTSHHQNRKTDFEKMSAYDSSKSMKSIIEIYQNFHIQVNCES